MESVVLERVMFNSFMPVTNSMKAGQPLLSATAILLQWSGMFFIIWLTLQG